MSEAYPAISLFQKLEVKYTLQKEAYFAIIRLTTPATPLPQAYQGGFFYV